MNLHQVVHAPTRGSNILDLLFVSDIFSKGVVEIENGISDHQLNSFMVSMSESHVRLPHEKTEVRDYHKADDESIIDYLDLHLNIVDRDVELSWQAFTGTITYCTDKFIPLKSIKKPLSNPWLSRDIIQTRRRLKKMKKKHKFKSPMVIELINNLLAKVEKAQDRFFNHSLSDFIINSPQKFWRYLGQSKKPHKK